LLPLVEPRTAVLGTPALPLGIGKVAALLLATPLNAAPPAAAPVRCGGASAAAKNDGPAKAAMAALLEPRLPEG
jgi:hypothetical protein